MAVQARIVDVEQAAGNRIAVRIGLDVLHAHQVGARRLRQHDAVAGGADRVGGLVARAVVGVILLAHLHAGAEAAGREDDAVVRLEADGVAVLLGVRAGHAGHAAVLDDEGVHTHVIIEVDADLLGLRAQLAHKLLAGRTNGHEGAGHGVAAEVHELVLPDDANVVAQPLGARERVVRQRVDQLNVRDVAAALEHIGHQLLGAVRTGLLEPVARGRHLRAGEQRGAGRHLQLFDNRHGGARLAGGHGSRETGAARTDDHDVVGALNRHRGMLHGDRRQILHLNARFLERIAHRQLEARGRQRRASNRVNIDRVARYHACSEDIHRLINDLRLVALKNGDAAQLAVLKYNADADVAALAGARALKRAGHSRIRHGPRRQAEDQNQRQKTRRNSCLGHFDFLLSFANRNARRHCIPLSCFCQPHLRKSLPKDGLCARTEAT